MTRKPDIRHPSTARIVARQMQATPPPSSWWARKRDDGSDPTWEEWTAQHREEAKRMTAVTTTQHIQRREGDR